MLTKLKCWMGIHKWFYGLWDVRRKCMECNKEQVETPKGWENL